MDEKEKMIVLIKSATNYDDFAKRLFDYFLFRLEIPYDVSITSIYYLVLYSIRIKMPGEDIKTLEERISKVDCHQTSYVVSKKALLMMEVERMLNVKIGMDNIVQCDDFDYYTHVLWEKINELKV